MANNIILKNSNNPAIIPVDPGQIITVEFEPSGAMFDRADADLIMSFSDGGSVTLADFFVADAQGNLPSIQLSDGEIIAGGDFLLGLDAGFDVSPAAGAQQSGGMNEYADNSGSLIGGLDLSDSLGTLHWDSTYAAAEAPTGATAPAAEGAGPQGQSPVPPVVSDGAYHTRLVVNSSANGEMRIAAFDENGNMLSDASAIDGCRMGNALYFNPPAVDPVTGELIVSLTAEGLAALEQGVAFEDIMYVTVNGQEYPVHVVGNSGAGGYDAAAAEAASDLPGPLYAEHYSHESGGILADADISLGGEKYNQADVNVSLSSGTASGTGNSNISLADGVAGQVNVSAETANGSAYGVRVMASGDDASSVIDAGSQGDVNISASSDNATAMGLVTQSGTNSGGSYYESSAEVRGRNINISAQASERTAAGVWASGKSTVDIEAEGDVHFSSTSTGGTVNYLTTAAYAVDQSTVNISGKNVSAESNALAGGGADGAVMATGFRTTAGTEMNINTAADGTFSVKTYQEHSPYSSPYSGVSWSGGRSAGFTSIGVSASGNVNQNNQGTRSAMNINAGDVNIESSVDAASGKGTATGVYAGYGGDVTINSSDLNNTLNIRGDAPSWGVGVFSTNNGTTTINTGAGDDVINIGGSAHNGAAAIGLASQAGGHTYINGGEGNDTVNINTTFTGEQTLGTDYMNTTGGAFGMNSAWGYASNEIRGVENVNITADASGSNTGWGYGMFVQDSWGYSVKNIIENSDSPLTVVITAKAGSSGQAYAMYGIWGGHNLIQGGSQAGDLNGDSITLNGHVGGGNILNEVRTGNGNDSIEINGNLTGATNSFSMGAGDDRFVLNGDITGGNNTLNLGDGDDTFVLNGKVGGNGITVYGGDGYDTLVLQADSYADFVSKYDAWLKGSLGNIQVENIHVNINGLSGDDQAALEGYFGDSHFDGYDVGYSSGNTVFAGLSAESIQELAMDLSGLLNADENEPGLLGLTDYTESLQSDIAPSAVTDPDSDWLAVTAENTYAEGHYDNDNAADMAMLQQEIIISAGG